MGTSNDPEERDWWGDQIVKKAVVVEGVKKSEKKALVGQCEEVMPGWKR